MYDIDYNLCTDFALFIEHEINCFQTDELLLENDAIIMNGPILTRSDLQRAIDATKLNKYVGIDGVLGEAFKNNFAFIILENILHISFINNVFIVDWRTSIIKPISKKSTINQKPSAI